MDITVNIIQTMGIISNEVYNDDYFTVKPDGTLLNDQIEGTTYQVIEHTPASNNGFK